MIRLTHVFNVGARVDGDHVTVLDAEVVADDTIDSSTAVIKLIVGKDDKHRVLSLLASDEDGVASEQLEGVHGGLGQGDDTVVIVDGIGNPDGRISTLSINAGGRRHLHQLVGLLLLLQDRSRSIILLRDR